ncbi:hypothetical protein E6H29_05705 [Candidatus Bathyarchaeota archaeon]|nr:MAG: hypothetical protein E6H29_05705 [Candidatus Bathyarchaeota archaeon]
MDGGIDDALALILALRSPELDVAGITAVSGNVPVEQAAMNALRVVELLERKDVWVARGLANPLVRDPVRAMDFHGADGLGDSELPSPSLRPRAESALSLIKQESQGAGRRRLSIVATGPLTNIAAVFTEESDIVRRLDDVVIMGGAYGLTEYGVGNETPAAEFNIYSDPEAAKIVFESGVSLKCVGLDVTMTPGAQLSPREYATIKRSETDHAQFAAKILAKAMGREKRFALHDPMAIAMKVRPSLFKFQDYHVNVETKGEYTTGMTVSDRRDRPSKELQGQRIAVCKDAKAAAFKQVFLRRLMSR